MTIMYFPKFFVTKKQFDEASEEERIRFNYQIVDDAPLKLPENCCEPSFVSRNETVAAPRKNDSSLVLLN